MFVVKTRVVVLGSTGSIGTQALEIIAENPERFELIGISAHGSKPELLLEQAKKFNLSTERVAVASDVAADFIEAELGGHTIRGTDSARELVEAVANELTENDVILNALVGSLGLDATLTSLQTPAKMALPTKNRSWLVGNWCCAALTLGSSFQ